MEEVKIFLIIVGISLLAVYIHKIIKIIKPMKKSLKIDELTALRLYPKADNELKTILEESFGVDFFKPKDITEVVDDEAKLAKHLGLKMDDLFVYGEDTEDPFEKYMNACSILPRVGKVYNEGTKLDFRNVNVTKWAPYKDGRYGSVSFHVWCYDLRCPAGFYFKDCRLAEKSYNNFSKHWEAFWAYEEK